MQKLKKLSSSVLVLLLLCGCFLRFSSVNVAHAADTLFNYQEQTYQTGITNASVRVNYTFPQHGEISHLGGQYQQLKVPVDVTVEVWNFNDSNIWCQNFFTFDFGARSPYTDTSSSVSRWIFESFESDDLYLMGVYPTGQTNHWSLQVGIGAQSVYNGAPNGMTFPRLQITAFKFRINMIFQSMDTVNSWANPVLTASSISLTLASGVWDTTDIELSGNAQIIQGITEQTQQQQQQYEDFTDSQDQQGADAIEDTQTAVEAKLGLFDFVQSIGEDLLGLFEVDEDSSTVITFPSWEMEIGGETHTFWSDIPVDLSDVETRFPALMVSVRFATVAIVYLALINYLIKLYHRIFG